MTGKNISHGKGKYGVVVTWKEGGTTTYWSETKEKQTEEFKRVKRGLSYDHKVSKKNR
jgi:hypothetical protein